MQPISKITTYTFDGQVIYESNDLEYERYIYIMGGVISILKISWINNDTIMYELGYDNGSIDTVSTNIYTKDTQILLEGIGSLKSPPKIYKRILVQENEYMIVNYDNNRVQYTEYWYDNIMVYEQWNENTREIVLVNTDSGQKQVLSEGKIIGNSVDGVKVYFVINYFHYIIYN